jgi:hypothetical protein
MIFYFSFLLSTQIPTSIVNAEERKLDVFSFAKKAQDVCWGGGDPLDD